MNERDAMFEQRRQLAEQCNCGVGGVTGPCPFHGVRPARPPLTELKAVEEAMRRPVKPKKR